MYEEITGICLRGGRFEIDTPLKVFPNKDVTRLSLIYGKNGEGKSTLSRGFYHVVTGTGDGIEDAFLIDEAENVVSLTPDELKNIFVFNEDFVDANIKIKEDGIDTIVVLGNKQETEKALEEKEEELVNERLILNRRKDKLEEFVEKKNDLSPECYKQKINASLKGMDNWAGRKAKIEGKAVAARVSENTYEQFINIKPTETRDSLMISFDKKMNELQEARKGVKKIERKVCIQYIYDIEENEIIETLSLKIEKPVLTEREKYLVELGTSRTKEIRTFFKSEQRKLCPFCLQNVSDEYRDSLFDSIEKILNEKVKEHEDELRKICLKKIVWDNYEEFEAVDALLVKACTDAIEKYNNDINDLSLSVEQKLSDVYVPVNVTKKALHEQYKKIIELLDNLEKRRIDYNASAIDTTKIMEDLFRINDEIAACDIKENYKKLKQSEKN